jgi:hypothetical protein
MSPKLQEELLQRMARLPEEEQQRVLAFVKGLTPAIEEECKRSSL